MRTLDRRNWLKAAGLSSGFIFLGGLESVAQQVNTRALPASGPVKLNANENPFSPSINMQKVLTDNFDLTCRYPFRVLSGLVEKIAEKEGVTKDHVVVTGGSTEGLKATGLLYGSDGGEIIAADPTFQALLRYAETFGAYVHRVRVNDEMQHDLQAMSQRVTARTRLIFICNPNNPTGALYRRKTVKQMLDVAGEHDLLVLSDEIYDQIRYVKDYVSTAHLAKDLPVVGLNGFSKVYLMTSRPKIRRPGRDHFTCSKF